VPSTGSVHSRIGFISCDTHEGILPDSSENLSKVDRSDHSASIHPKFDRIYDVMVAPNLYGDILS
jgi:isocitrate/isopropylmalate dehydrogenase